MNPKIDRRIRFLKPYRFEHIEKLFMPGDEFPGVHERLYAKLKLRGIAVAIDEMGRVIDTIQEEE